MTILWRGETALVAPAAELTVPDVVARWSATARRRPRDVHDDSARALPALADDRARRGAPRIVSWLRTRAAWILLLDIALVAVFTALSPQNVFWSSAMPRALMLGMSQTLLLALGLAMMLGAGIFDLSLGANLVLSSVVVAHS